MDPERRERIVQAAADLFSAYGVINVGRHDVARRADVTMRSVNGVSTHRTDLLREVLERLPASPVTEALRAQAESPSDEESGVTAMSALLFAAHEALGNPSAAWDPIELQALTAAPYDDALRALVGFRVERRWDAVREVLQQLEIMGDRDDMDAAVLHVLAVGIGVAVLAPVLPGAHDTRAWTALAARIMQSLSVREPQAGKSLGFGPTAHTWRARLQVPSGPDSIAHLTRVLSMLNVSPVTMTVAPVDADGSTSLIDLILRSSNQMSRAMVVDSLRTVGEDVVVGRGQEGDVDDVAARVLELSTRLLGQPEFAPQAAAELLLADSWQVVDASVGEDSSPYAARLQWTVDRHVIVRRANAPFTSGEYARATALLELMDAVTVAHGAASFGWLDTLADGTELVTRLARPEDTVEVENLHRRCSPESLYQRYFTPKNTWREENLRRISGGHRGVTLVVTQGEAEIVAIGNAFPLTPEEGDSDDFTRGEVALLVDDAWHGRGVGRLLLNHLVESAPQLGFTHLVAFVLEGNVAMQSLLDADVWEARPAPDLGANAREFGASLARLSVTREPTSSE